MTPLSRIQASMILLAILAVSCSGPSAPVKGSTSERLEVREGQREPAPPRPIVASGYGDSPRLGFVATPAHLKAHAPISTTSERRCQVGFICSGNRSPSTVITPEPHHPPILTQTVESAIHSAARVYGLDATLMTRIAFCESGLRPDAKNRNSTATGLFQHIDTTWTANVQRMRAPYTLADRTNPAASSMVAAFMISGGNIGAWSESQKCWS